MRLAIFDTESDGLLDVATTIHCAAVKDIETGNRKSFTPKDINHLTKYLSSFDVLIGHNVIGHDFPLIRKIYGWEFRGTVVDTLLMSRLQRPNRTYPKDAPKNSGPHSVQTWGYRVGRGKVEHEDWTTFTPAVIVTGKQQYL